MTYRELLLAWRLLLRADGRFEIRQALRFAPDDWQMLIEDQIHDLQYHCIQYGVLVAVFPDALPYAPIKVTPVCSTDARLTMVEVWRILDAVETGCIPAGVILGGVLVATRGSHGRYQVEIQIGAEPMPLTLYTYDEAEALAGRWW